MLLARLSIILILLALAVGAAIQIVRPFINCIPDDGQVTRLVQKQPIYLPGCNQR